MHLLCFFRIFLLQIWFQFFRSGSRKVFRFCSLVISPIFFSAQKPFSEFKRIIIKGTSSFGQLFPSSSTMWNFHFHRRCFIWNVASELSFGMIGKYFLQDWDNNGELKHQTSQKLQTQHCELNFAHILPKHTSSRKTRDVTELPIEKSIGIYNFWKLITFFVTLLDKVIIGINPKKTNFRINFTLKWFKSAISKGYETFLEFKAGIQTMIQSFLKWPQK